MANIDQSYCFHQARRDLPPIGQKAYSQQKSHINKEFIGCYQQCKKYIFIFYIKQTLIGVSNYDALGIAGESGKNVFGDLLRKFRLLCCAVEAAVRSVL